MVISCSAEKEILLNIWKTKFIINVERTSNKSTTLICLKLVGFGPVLSPPNSKTAHNRLIIRKRIITQKNIFLFTVNLREASFNLNCLEMKNPTIKKNKHINETKNIRRRNGAEERHLLFSTTFLLYFTIIAWS